MPVHPAQGDYTNLSLIRVRFEDKPLKNKD